MRTCGAIFLFFFVLKPNVDIPHHLANEHLPVRLPPPEGPSKSHTENGLGTENETVTANASRGRKHRNHFTAVTVFRSASQICPIHVWILSRSRRSRGTIFSRRSSFRCRQPKAMPLLFKISAESRHELVMRAGAYIFARRLPSTDRLMPMLFQPVVAQET